MIGVANNEISFPQKVELNNRQVFATFLQIIHLQMQNYPKHKCIK